MSRSVPQGLSLDLRYRLLDREHAPFGLLIDAEPHWGRIDETTGEPVDQYGVDLLIGIEATMTTTAKRKGLPISAS
jgi:hypothetical protein